MINCAENNEHKIKWRIYLVIAFLNKTIKHVTPHQTHDFAIHAQSETRQQQKCMHTDTHTLYIVVQRNTVLIGVCVEYS